MEFLDWKANKQWLWLALDRISRQVVALFVSDRSADGALGLWQALPEKYRLQATFHTDDWQAYKQTIPAEQHRFSEQKKIQIMWSGFFVCFVSDVLV